MEKSRETKLGNLILRMRPTKTGVAAIVIDGKDIKAREEGDNPEDVWRRIHDAAARLNPLFIGYSSARARFFSFFKDGFGGDYPSGERDYKVAARDLLASTVPLDSVTSGKDFGERILAVYRKTNLLASFEQMRIQDLLRGPDADAFVRHCADFASGDMKMALAALKKLLKPYDCAKWTIVTYLPFLWKPDAHIFLKPTVMKTFAERVGHRFANVYTPDLDVKVYESLLDLAREAQDETADLNPQDMIDIQSFIWTVVEY
jgi:hypothetical protein